MSRRDEILARLEALHDGNWYVRFTALTDADGEFIAHAPEDIRWLLERYARLEGVVTDWGVDVTNLMRAEQLADALRGVVIANPAPHPDSVYGRARVALEGEGMR